MKRLLTLFFLIIFAQSIFSADTRIKIFKRTGTGAAVWDVGNIGSWTPDCIIVIGDSVCWWTSAMGTDQTLNMADLDGLHTGYVKDVGQDSIWFGSVPGVNGNGTEYFVCAIQTDGVYSKVGTYTGDGNNDRWLEFDDMTQIDFFMTETPGLRPICGFSSIPDDTAKNVYPAGGMSALTGLLQSFNGDSVQLGTGAVVAWVNANSTAYYYLALASVDSIINVSSLTGNNGADRDVTPWSSYTPDFYLGTNCGDHTTNTVFRTSDQRGASSDWAVNAVGTSSAGVVDALIAGGYTVTYTSTLSSYLNKTSDVDGVLLLKSGSYITTSQIGNVIVIF